MLSRILFIFTLFSLYITEYTYLNAQSCVGLDADAGPDLFTCDPSMPVQLMGNYNGNPGKIYWTPATYLSDPNSTDPIVNAPAGKYTYTFTVEAVSSVNLIVNGDFESGNSGFTHNYNYGLPGGPFGPGWLSVGPNPIAYNGGWTNCGDHTTGSGNQLIVDGHTTPNSNLWCQTVSLTVGKTYLFRFYVQSVYPVAQANLIAKANNTNFGSVMAGAVCDWQMFEACFVATSSSTQLCIEETTNVGFGNDFTIDDIELFEKCMDKDDVMVEVVDVKAKIDVPQLPKCASDIFNLNAIGSSTGINISYEWRTEGGKIVSQNGLNAKGQGSGKYFIKVIYKNGSVVCEKEVEIEITASDDLEGIMEVEGIANCNSDTIILRAQANNGSGNFTFQWISQNKIHRGKTDSVAFVTDAGVYKVVIRDADSGCEIELQDIVVSDTSAPNLQLRGDSLISCLNKNAKLIGGPFDTSRFSYQWLLPDSSSVKNKDSLIVGTAGTYLLRMEDKINKCFTEKSISVKIDTLTPTINLGNDLIIDCIHPEVDIIPTGNNPNARISYNWSLPSGNLPAELALQNKKENKAGWVILNLTNQINGCQFTDSLYITDIRKLPKTDAGSGGTINCIINEISLNGNGSQTDSAIYNWSSPNGIIRSGDMTLNPIVSDSGWYYLVVEDRVSHCKNTDSVYVSKNVNRPNANLEPDKIFTCSDTILSIDGSQSSSGSQLKFEWISANGIIYKGQGSNILQVKSAGEYILIVTDTTNACNDTARISIKPDLNFPIVAISIPDTINCRNPTIMLRGMASSGSGNPIQFNWFSQNGQNIINPNSLNPSVSEAGDYFLNVKDLVNGCNATVKVTVIIDTLLPVANAGFDEIWNCTSSQITLDGSLSKGEPNLQFNWSTLDGVITGNNQLNKIIVVSPGSYTLLVTNPTNGCESTDQVTILKDLVVPLAFIPTPDTLNCKVSSITLSSLGSSSGNRISYQWNTTNGQISSKADSTEIIITKPGTYQLIVTDTINFCTGDRSIIVVEDKMAPIIDAGGPAEMDCSQLDLVLNGSVTGNPQQQNILWSTFQGNIIGPPDRLQIMINRPGIYYLMVTNSSNGCSTLDSISVLRKNNLIVDAGASRSLTCQLKEIDLNGFISNGTGNESILWTTRQGHIIGNPNANPITVDSTGIYYFQVSNPITGCSAIDSVIITANKNVPVGINLNLKQAKCPGDNWEAEILDIQGGSLPLQYFLDNVLYNSTTFRGTTSGNHIIKIVDNNGCELTSSFLIINPTPIDVQLTPLVKLQAGENYNIVPVYSIPDDSIAWTSWSPADFLSCTDCKYPMVQNINRETEYVVTYANQNGCMASARIKIEIVLRDIWIPNSFSPNGDNINDHFYPMVKDDSYNEIRSMRIYDRWGNQLYESNHFQPNDPNSGWSGMANHQHANPGVYIYLIELEWKNGEVEKFYGNLTLLR